MKTKKVTVERVETIAFDNQQLHCGGDDCHAVIELKNQGEHGKVAQGDTITISVEKAKKAKAEKKADK